MPAAGGKILFHREISFLEFIDIYIINSITVVVSSTFCKFIKNTVRFISDGLLIDKWEVVFLFIQKPP